MLLYSHYQNNTTLRSLFEDDDEISKLITPKMSRASVARTSSNVGILLIVDIIVLKNLIF